MKRIFNILLSNYKRLLFYLVLTALGCLLFYYNIHLMGGNVHVTYLFSMVVYVVAIPILLTYLNRNNHRLTKSEKTVSIVLSVLFSQFITIGSYVESVTFASKFLDSYATVGIWFAQSVIYSYLAYYFVKHIIYEIQNNQWQSKDIKHVNIRKFFWILLSVNIVFIFILYPCFFDFDSAIGLRTFIDPNEIKTNHNPYFVQMIHGAFWRIGLFLGNASIGFALLTLLFSIISTAILTYGISLFNPFFGRKSLVFVAALLPFYVIITHCPNRDSFFSYALLLYSLTIIDLLFSQFVKIKAWKWLLLHIATIILVCLTRNQGLIIIVVESLVLIPICKKNRLILTSAVVLSIALVLLFNKVYMPYKNVQPTSKGEVFGMLFQQTALYLIQHPDNVTQEEADAISQILPIDVIKENYKPTIVDPVKAKYGVEEKYFLYRKNTSSDDTLRHYNNHIAIPNESEKLAGYFSAWFTMFLKHPICYFDAQLAVCNGFFYNERNPLIDYAAKWRNSEATSADYVFYQNVQLQNFITIACIYSVHMPVLCWFTSMPYYIWLFLIILSIVIIRKDTKGMALMVPSVLSLLIILVCPVATARYMYPILVCLPFYVLYLLKRQ